MWYGYDDKLLLLYTHKFIAASCTRGDGCGSCGTELEYINGRNLLLSEDEDLLSKACACACIVQWTLINSNSPVPGGVRIRISENFNSNL